MTLSYYKKKPKKYCGFNEDTDEYNPKTIQFGTDLERIINENYNSNRNLINNLYKEIEALKESEVK